MRQNNTDSKGSSFGPLMIGQVWEKGNVILGYAPNEWRQECCGNYIFRGDYGGINSRYGWEIDHIRPVSSSGGDELANLQPLQWQNNRSKADNYPQWSGAGDVDVA